MNVVTRGFRNAFRNGVRTLSVVVILGLSIGLSLTMLIANKAVGNKIASVKSSIGNTITIAPAGFNPGSQANNALTTSDLDKVKAVAHVSNITETLTDRLSTTGTSSNFGRFGDSSSDSSTTSLTSPVTLSSNGPRFFMGGNNSSSDSTGSAPTTFSLPISLLGTTDTSSIDGSTITLSSGKTISGTNDTNDALISQAMATKNNLKAGSTFTAYDKTLTVAGIFTASTQSARGTVVLPLAALQRLSGQSGVVTSAVVTVDSLDNLSSVTSAIKSKLGNTADVTSAEEQADSTVKPLNSVKTVSLFSLIGAVVAGAIIILLVMVMVVRERKREIGIVKAIGGSNLSIISEFMVEALALTVAGAIIGLVIGVIAGQPVTNALVDSSTSSNSQSAITARGFGTRGTGQQTGGPGGAMTALNRNGFGGRFRNTGAVRGISNINAQIGWGILLDGFGAAVLIAVIGSALATGMISKVRPSEVLRSA